ncbi:Na+/H+ antiporter [Brevibacterium zhoupengii]|uniref:Na+/H+ antiporter n=1 Tax=Brevibacterium zhoupengii TaxID=2898795 RepID=UPI001E2C2504|nr:Na+/H+ antiporter [Brevibacterium zhoupengii]
MFPDIDAVEPVCSDATHIEETSMTTLLMIIGFGAATSVVVGLGQKLRLPWPALMVVIGIAGAFIPTFAEITIEPELILPLFLPPLLFAAAQKTSWALFAIRWRTILGMAVALVGVTVAAVAGTAVLLIPGITIAAAIALGAMLAPPDPVAVDAVAGTVSIPRRIMSTLQSEGLFNDAASLVIFQTAMAAAMSGTEVDFGQLALSFLISAIIAIAVGLIVVFVVWWVMEKIDHTIARSSLMLMLPFGVYLIAEHFHASGVIAVVVAALEVRRRDVEGNSAERVTQASTWQVLEMLITGIAFGLIGLDLRMVVESEHADLGKAVLVGLGIALIVIAVRFGWLLIGTVLENKRREEDPDAAPLNIRDATLMTWGGMRGLATIALALSIPATTDTGEPFPGRSYILVTAAVILLVTLVLAGLTFPTIVNVLGIDDEAEKERQATKEIAARAYKAALHQIKNDPTLPDEVAEPLRARFKGLYAELLGTSDDQASSEQATALKENREVMAKVQTRALQSARTEVLKARRERGTDPEIADRVLRRFDLQSVLLR